MIIGDDTRLSDLTNCLYLDEQGNVTLRTGFAGDINISGNVTIPSKVKIDSSDAEPVIISLTTSTIVPVTLQNPTISVDVLNTSIPVSQSGHWVVNVDTGSIHVSNFTSTVRVSSLPNITGVVSVVNFTSTVRVASLPTIYGHVTALPVTTTGTHYSFNNSQSPYVLDSTLRPVGSFSISTNSNLFNVSELVDIQFYCPEPIVYELYEGSVQIIDPQPPTISTIGSWTMITAYTDATVPEAGSQANTSAATLKTSGFDRTGVLTSSLPHLVGGAMPTVVTLLAKSLTTTATLYFSVTVKELAN